jgi:hypothetical protein
MTVVLAAKFSLAKAGAIMQASTAIGTVKWRTVFMPVVPEKIL